MATIVAETGSGSATANSYVTAAELATYAADRNVTVTATAAVLLIKAMDYIESKSFIGGKMTSIQALQWPRYGVRVDGYYVASDSIPTLLKEAQMEISLGIDGGDNPLAKQERLTKKEKVGPLEVEYASSSRASTYLTAGETKLRKLTTQSIVLLRV